MSRTVINVEEIVDLNSAQPIVCFRVQEPTGVPDGTRFRRLPLGPTDAPFAALTALPMNGGVGGAPGAVATAGRAIHDGLITHPGFFHAMNQALATATPTQVQPIYIETTALTAEKMPWEILYHPDKAFLSLDNSWRMARMTGGGQGGELRRFYQGRLVVAAVLGADGVSAKPEWDALEKALAKVPCHVHAFVAESTLHAHVSARNLPWVTINMMPQNESALLDQLKGIKPQIVHAFCHGSSEAFLAIANKNTLQLGAEPFYLSSDDLRVLKESLWLAVLNCCEGAAATETHSLAYSLVSAGIPAAIGMREPIDRSDASIFTAAFYTNLAASFGTAFLAGTRTPVEWASLMLQARRELCRKHGNNFQGVARDHKEWTLPVLYQRPEQLIVEVASPSLSEPQAQQLFGHLDTLRAMRASMHPSTPAAKLQALDVLIQQLESQLRQGP